MRLVDSSYSQGMVNIVVNHVCWVAKERPALALVVMQGSSPDLLELLWKAAIQTTRTIEPGGAWFDGVWLCASTFGCWFVFGWASSLSLWTSRGLKTIDGELPAEVSFCTAAIRKCLVPARDLEAALK